ncbi:hypothetical protein [Geodermatophilus sp. DSM 45219]|uniref:hypothetical protein n=1 Tax=Geodermatophilus sp. DSM 45219 TaxID=1881103 RepID=UPI00088E0A01|nr:hypothetical protein [Geodermatophilus sp. DSM 45219]SDN41947.1 hypothetical protein SAMN05428965_0316 [Geodermatophilus sp. DSM 45219]
MSDDSSSNQGASPRIPHAYGRGTFGWRGSATAVAGVTATATATVGTVWAGAASPVDSASLIASARRHAARGMRARGAGAGEHDDASLQLGIMLEHLAKAYLASLHPTLLLERNFDFFSLVRLAGQGQGVKPGHVLRTVGMHEALVRVGTVRATGNEDAGRAFAKRFGVVLQARNGVAHIGEEGGVADQVAQLAVQGADEILTMMGQSLSDLFGDYTDAAEALRNEHATKVHQFVTLLVARAKDAFRERFADLGEEQNAELARLDRQLVAQLATTRDRIAVRCPACHRQGILSGSPDLIFEDVDAYVDEHGVRHRDVVGATAVLFADTFRCPVCGLRLRGQEELEEADLSTALEIGPAVLEDFEDYEDYDADEEEYVPDGGPDDLL